MCCSVCYGVCCGVCCGVNCSCHSLIALIIISLLASQEYYIRRMDGRVGASEVEKMRILKCVEAAIERRCAKVSNGVEPCIVRGR